jgi:hypothetical protein
VIDDELDEKRSGSSKASCMGFLYQMGELCRTLSPDISATSLYAKHVARQPNATASGVRDQLGDDGRVLSWTTTDAVGLNRQVTNAKPQADRARNILSSIAMVKPRQLTRWQPGWCSTPYPRRGSRGGPRSGWQLAMMAEHCVSWRV